MIDRLHFPTLASVYDSIKWARSHLNTTHTVYVSDEEWRLLAAEVKGDPSDCIRGYVTKIRRLSDIVW